MVEFVKICPKCGDINPEYENLCAKCRQFIGMESSVPKPQKRQQESDVTSPVETLPKATDEKGRRNPDPVESEAMVTGASIYLQPVSGGEILTIVDGSVLGQSHVPSEASVQIPAEVDGVAYVHRQHCSFQMIDGNWIVTPIDQKPLGQKFNNPTLVNQQAVTMGESHLLQDGDELQLSGVIMRVKIL